MSDELSNGIKSAFKRNTFILNCYLVCTRSQEGCSRYNVAKKAIEGGRCTHRQSFGFTIQPLIWILFRESGSRYIIIHHWITSNNRVKSEFWVLIARKDTSRRVKIDSYHSMKCYDSFQNKKKRNAYLFELWNFRDMYWFIIVSISAKIELFVY